MKPQTQLVVVKAWLILFLPIMLISIPRQGIGQGVEFHPISIREGMNLAQAENKNLFIMFGTTHCPHSMDSFVELQNDKLCGDFMNENFISLGYGDSTVSNAKKWHDSEKRVQFSKIENELETVFCNYFIFPNYFFFSKDGEILLINSGPKKPKKILAYSQSINEGKSRTPFLFNLKFNNKAYSKNKHTYKMLSHCLNAYLLIDVPADIDYNKKEGYFLEDFTIQEKNLLQSKIEIENSLAIEEYYFNCFLASLIYEQNNETEKALKYAKKGLFAFPKHWNKSRKSTDQIMKELIKKYE